MADTQTQQPNIPNPLPNVRELVDKAKEIYNSLRGSLEPRENGKYIVIEVNSSKYFIGDTKDETMIQARKEFPKVILFIRRIGELEKVSHHFSSLSPKKYASIF